MSEAVAGTEPDLRASEWVEVRGANEILATLDAKGELDGLPFMPEMLRFCGQRLRVERSAHKTCDTITGRHVGLRLQGSVHLERARCDGSAHGGCQAECLLFWKDAWLRRVEPSTASGLWRLLSRARGRRTQNPGCTTATLTERALRPAEPGETEPRYRCQATELLRATTPLAWWEPTQYLRDVASGNVRPRELVGGIVLRAWYHFVFFGPGHRVKQRIYDALARIFAYPSWPYAEGTVQGRTPSATLDLHPGERVRIRSHPEILGTLDRRMNRGMGFAPEMASYCGVATRVRSRVERILDEKTGKMLRMKSECIVLEDVICRSDCSANRLFCPRGIYSYWREIWLRREESD